MSSPETFDVCLSFANEDRAYVESVAGQLKAAGLRVFYDDYEEAEMWGEDLYKRLGEIYQNQGKYCVVFVSAYYASKVWTQHELKNAQERALNESRVYLLPARFDDTELPGLPKGIAYIDLRKRTPEALAGLIVRKVRQAKPEERKRRWIWPTAIAALAVAIAVSLMTWPPDWIKKTGQPGKPSGEPVNQASVGSTQESATAGGPIVNETSAAITDTTFVKPLETVGAIEVSPARHDYGAIGRGRRMREFEVRNTTDVEIALTVSRSVCRCLFYEHDSIIPARGSGTLIVTIDGARVGFGPIRERLIVADKRSTNTTSVEVAALVE